MAGDTEDADAALRRLEAALEHIASQVGPYTPPATTTSTPPVAEIAARLDAMIERLRAALGDTP